KSNPWSVRVLLEQGILASFLFLAGVSHIYQTLFLWWGGFMGTAPGYHAWLFYQIGWFVDVLLFNVFSNFAVPISPIHPQPLWAQAVVCALNLVLVAVVVNATYSAYNEYQFWRRRIRGEL